MLDAVIGQNEAQARNMWRIREGVGRGRLRRGPGPQLRHLGVDLQDPEFIDKGISGGAGHPARPPAPPARPYRRRQRALLASGRRRAWIAQTLQQYAPAITRAVNDLITSMAGSISAEHGIGIDKLDELAHYRSKIELDTMRTIKRALDPKNIMNPGKDSCGCGDCMALRRQARGHRRRQGPDRSTTRGKHPYLTDWRENYLGTALRRRAAGDDRGSGAAVVKLCAAEKVAIVPPGRQYRHGRAAARRREDGREIVLSLTRMNRILEIDTIGYAMTVEAGVVLQDHPGGARRPTTGCSRSASAPRAAAPSAAISRPMPAACRSLHYGNARQLVLGLEVVHADGRHLERLARAQEGQYRLRPARPLSRRRGHARHHHQGDAEALAQAQGHRDLVDRPCPRRRPPSTLLSGAYAASRGQRHLLRADEPARASTWC